MTPWTWWAISFDFHSESLAVLFTALLARDLWHGRRRAWLWIACVLICGDVAGTYVAGLGMGLIAGRKGSRKRGLLLTAVGVASVLFITIIHGNEGSAHGLQAYAYIANGGPKPKFHMSLLTMVTGMLTHPVTLFGSLWHKNVDMWANLGATGFVGLGVPALAAHHPGRGRGQLAVPRHPVRRAVVPEPAGLHPDAGRDGRHADVAREETSASDTGPDLPDRGSGDRLGSGVDARHVPSVAQGRRPCSGDPCSGREAHSRSAQVFVSQGVIGRFSGRTEIRPLPLRGPCQSRRTSGSWSCRSRGSRRRARRSPWRSSGR